jgi:hypothetical protein
MEATIEHQTVYEINQLVEESQVKLCFKGDFDQSLLHSVLGFWELRHGQHTEPLFKNRMFSFIVEAFQNISKHAQKDGEQISEGIILIGKKKDSYFLSTGNCIDTKESVQLEERLRTLKALNTEELKALHKKELLSTELSSKSGANLGLLNIARRCKDFNFRILPLDEKVSFFEFEVIV